MALFDPADIVQTPHGPMPGPVAAALGLHPAQQPMPQQLSQPSSDIYMHGPRGAQQPPPSLDLLAGAAPPPVAGAPIAAPPETPQLPPPAASPASAPAPDAVSGAAPAQPPAPPAPTAPAAEPGLTAEDLRQGGIAGAANASIKATQDQAAAGQATADAQAKEQLAFADAYDKRNAEIDKQLAARSKALEQAQQQINARITDYDAAVKQYASTKIDRSVDHPILAAISLVLGGIGAAMAHSGQNPALAVLEQQIQRKVQGQLADRQALGNVVQMKRSDIDLLRQRASDQTAQYNLAIAGETEKAARQIEAIGARSNSDIVRARANEAAAQLRSKVADTVGQAVMAQQAKDERDRAFAEQVRESKVSEGLQRAQVGIAGGHLALARDQFAYQKQKDAQDFALAQQELAAKGQQAEAAALQKQLEKAQQLGINDASGNPLIAPEGQKAIAAADKLDQRAQQLASAAQGEKDPAKAQQLMTQAQMLQRAAATQRTQARAQYTVTARNDTDAVQLSKDVANARNTYAGLDELQHMIKDGSLTDPANRDRVRTAFAMISVEQAHALGARFNDREFEEFKSAVMGGDPTALKTMASKGTFGTWTTRFDQMQREVERGINEQVRARAINFTDPNASVIPHLPPPTEAEQLSQAVTRQQTPQEQAAGTEPGILRSGIEHVFYPLGDRPSDKARAAAENQKQSVYGLVPEQQKAVDRLIALAQGTGAKAEDARNRLVGLATGDRGSLANGVLNALRDKAPGVYHVALAKLPADVRAVRTAPAPPLPGMEAMLSVPDLVRGSIAGDEASKRELARRASAGDKEAAAGIQQVIGAIRTPGAR